MMTTTPNIAPPAPALAATPTSAPRHAEPITIALKEWSATIAALMSGDQAFLLRKGGIRETNRHFELAHRRFLLFPTRFHEARTALKSEFQHLAANVHNSLSGRPTESDAVSVHAWAEIHDVIAIDDYAQIAALADHHVWTDAFVAKRVAWKPRHAAHLMILRVHRLAQPVSIAVEPYHLGCKSWVDIEPPVDVHDSAPALSDATFAAASASIQRLVTTAPFPTLSPSS